MIVRAKEKDTNIREVFSSVRSTRLFTGSSSSDGLDGALKNVTEFEGLDKVTEANVRLDANDRQEHKLTSSRSCSCP